LHELDMNTTLTHPSFRTSGPDAVELTAALFGCEAFAATEMARIAKQVRTLIGASAAIQRVARDGNWVGAETLTAKILCEGILAEVRLLTSSINVPGGNRERHARLVQLLTDGLALADAFDEGAFDHPEHAASRLAEHAHRLGRGYELMVHLRH